jgi:hypothetical protein
MSVVVVLETLELLVGMGLWVLNPPAPGGVFGAEGEKNPLAGSKVELWHRSRMDVRICVRLLPMRSRVSLETWSLIRWLVANPICCLTHLPPVLCAPPSPGAFSAMSEANREKGWGKG